MAFAIRFTPEAQADLASLKKYEQAVILDGVKSQLTHEPAVETGNRKLRRDEGLGLWELRVGKCRVFYRTDPGIRVVEVVLVGRKNHNRLFVRDEEVRIKGNDSE